MLVPSVMVISPGVVQRAAPARRSAMTSALGRSPSVSMVNGRPGGRGARAPAWPEEPAGAADGDLVDLDAGSLGHEALHRAAAAAVRSIWVPAGSFCARLTVVSCGVVEQVGLEEGHESHGPGEEHADRRHEGDGAMGDGPAQRRAGRSAARVVTSSLSR